jgi:Glutamine synthetase
MQSKENLDSIKEFLNQSNIDYVKVAITDIDGVLRGKYMHKDKFLKACESGFGFCDVIFGWDSNDDLYEPGNLWYEPLTGWHSGFPDAKVKII